MASPFLKWAGGKGQLAPQLEVFFPRKIDGYIEPFVGGGAIFFYLRDLERIKGRIILADINEELINAYTAVRDNADELIDTLDAHKKRHCSEYYYKMRAETFTPGVEGAARTIYLNKTGFNGLYRVNSKGRFNVPLGSYSNPSIFDRTALHNASSALQGVELAVQDFHQSIAQAQTSDFIYLDPPYVPLSDTSSFTSYIPGGFGPEDQKELAQCLREADRRGVRFALSNSATDFVISLYDGFKKKKVHATRRINCDGNKRGVIDELIILNNPVSTVSSGRSGVSHIKRKTRQKVTEISQEVS
ncbi:MAG: DNA adenine methylase [Candidatus Xenobiia bacterium LiM19]